MYYYNQELALQKKRISIAIGISILLHLFFVTFSKIDWYKKNPPTLKVSLIELPSKTPEKKQIVSSPDLPETTEPVETAKLSEKNTKTEKEQIKRGVEVAKQVASKPQKAVEPQPKKTTESTPQKTSPTPKNPNPSLHLKDPLLNGLIASNLNSPSKESETQPQSEKREQLLREYKPYSKSNSSVLFTGNQGLSDFLPDIPDGDLTLLNTKADQYAVFVRRVALQVFGALRSSSWKSVSFWETRKIGKMVTVRAKLSPSGKLLGVSLLETSGSRAFDSALLTAAQTGAWDQNPPPGALAPDGSIYFIFKARTWSQPPVEGYPERRWLLLGTGLL